MNEAIKISVGKMECILNFERTGKLEVDLVIDGIDDKKLIVQNVDPELMKKTDCYVSATITFDLPEFDPSKSTELIIIENSELKEICGKEIDSFVANNEQEMINRCKIACDNWNKDN